MTTSASHALMVIDLAFGDCGKGTLVDFLARHHGAHTVVRFNGGPQAGHNVVTDDGRHHTFAQFGSATFLPNVRTLLSRFMLVEPYALFNEARHLESLGVADALDRMTLDADCPLITPFHQAANRIRELARGPEAHGTCGMGIGETMSDLVHRPDLIIRARDLARADVLRRQFNAIRESKIEQLRDALAKVPSDHADVATLLRPDWLDVAIETYAALAHRIRIEEKPALNCGGVTLFEGAQGVLLDENFGFHPHTTWSTTTFANANRLLDESEFTGQRTRIGVLRSYFTRHGAGPFVSEDRSLRSALPEPHNADTGWQGRFRVGLFDCVAARYAIKVAGGVDQLAITHLDRLPALPRRIGTAYANAAAHQVTVHLEPAGDLTAHLNRSTLLTTDVTRDYPGADAESAFLAAIEGELKTPIEILSRGPTAAQKSFRDHRA